MGLDLEDVLHILPVVLEMDGPALVVQSQVRNNRRLPVKTLPHGLERRFRRSEIDTPQVMYLPEVVELVDEVAARVDHYPPELLGEFIDIGEAEFLVELSADHCKAVVAYGDTAASG